MVWIALLLTCKPTCEQEVAACACEDGSTATACCPSARLTCDASIGITVPLPVCSEDDPCVELLDTYCLLDDGVTRIDRASDEPSCGTTDEGLDRDRPLYADIARSWVDGDGTRRWWCEYRPPSSGPDTPLPLLLFVPGSGGTADDVYDFTSLRTKAVDRDLGGGEGFVLVSSQARYLHWPTEQAQDGTKHDSYHRDHSVPAENRDEAFFDHAVDHGDEHPGIAARADRNMLARQRRRSRKTRVDDHELRAAVAQCAQPPRPVGCGRQTAVRLDRVRTEHQQIVGVIHVGNRDRQRVPEHQPTRDVFRHLIERARREEVPSAERPEEGTEIEGARNVVRVRVAGVGGQRAPPVLLDDALEAHLDGGKRFVPARFPQLAVAAHQRRSQPIGVVVKRADLDALGTHITATEDVVRVAADTDDALAFDVDREPTGGLTQRTGAVLRASVGHPAKVSPVSRRVASGRSVQLARSGTRGAG